MKKLFTILLTVSLTANAMGQGVKSSLPRDIDGCVLGVSTYREIVYSKDSNSLVSNIFPLVSSEKEVVWLGDFVYEGLHFDLVKMQFHNDTVYSLEFIYQEMNSDVWNMNKSFAENLSQKYAEINNFGDNEQDKDSFLVVAKRDEQSKMICRASRHSVTVYISDLWLEDLAFQARLEDLNKMWENLTNHVSYNAKYDPKNAVKSVAGVRFGDSRPYVLQVLNKKGKMVKDEGNLVYYSDFSLGGSIFSVAKFYFKRGILVSAEFEKNFHEWKGEEALMMYNSICSSYRTKYTNAQELPSDNGKKTMFCGMLTDDYQNGKLPPIIITYELGISRGGTKFYYVTASYYGARAVDAALDDL